LLDDSFELYGAPFESAPLRMKQPLHVTMSSAAQQPARLFWEDPEALVDGMRLSSFRCVGCLLCIVRIVPNADH